ncbi:MAG: hypothetical protein OXG81_15095 [Acidobacteria bacterium]|nr:hypothetical protein [Acidobacteriota bacterium]
MTDQPDVKERSIRAAEAWADPRFWIQRGLGGVARAAAKGKGERAEALSPFDPANGRPEARRPPYLGP